MRPGVCSAPMPAPERDRPTEGCQLAVQDYALQANRVSAERTGGTRVAREFSLTSLGHASMLEPSDRTAAGRALRSEEHTSELQSPCNLVCRLLLEKKKKRNINDAKNREHS